MINTKEETIKKQKIILVIAFLLLVSGISVAQPHYSFIKDRLKLSNENIHYIEPKEGHFITYISGSDGKVQTRDIDLTEELDIIVEFKEEPFFIQKNKADLFSKTV